VLPVLDLGNDASRCPQRCLITDVPLALAVRRARKFLTLSPTRLSGARESSSGDEFHVLWAARRVLGLLDPASELVRVVIEDLTPVPSAVIPPELLLGADMTEFYGGPELATADRVVITQLKYSERHPDKHWTGAALAADGSRGQKGVIARLADLYRAVSRTAERSDILGRLEIRLISNRPAGERLAHGLAAAKEWLAHRPQPARRADLLRALGARDATELTRLAVATGLGSAEFTDFLRVLDLSDLGTGSRAEQDLRVTEALSRHVLDDLRYASLSVAQLVRDRGLPEGEHIPIELPDLLAALDVHSPEALLPVPPRLNRPANAVPSPDARRLAEALADAPDRRLLAHGAAGVGKTTSVLALEGELPAGSVLITYDCFGEGSYETAGGARHLSERFALQLCNELAVRCRLPMLIRPPDSPHDLWRELERRIEASAGLLAEQGAQLVLVVDAADNTAWAGRRFGEETFLKWLWAQPLPEGACLLVTCRSARRDVVGAPDTVPQVELLGFDEDASAAHLRRRFPEAGDEHAQAFHANSGGNPRVQFYVLFEQRADSVATVADAVEQARKTPQDIFESLLAAAVLQAPDSAAAQAHLAELVCLTKPLTTGRFRRVSGMAAARVAAFCKGLEPGVIIDGAEIALRDEDFATFLRDTVGPDDERAAHSRLADLFATAEARDAYAASVLADHLHQAGRSADLIELAIGGPPPPAIDDPLARQQAYRRRLTLALRHTGDSDDRRSACQLVVLAGEAARQNQAVAEILRRRPGLGMRYSDPEAVMRIYGSDPEADWHGPVHMQLAAFYARRGEDGRARDEARIARAWLIRRAEQGNEWKIEADEIAAYAEAAFYLAGAERAAAEVRSWQPGQFALQVAVALVRRLARGPAADRLAALIPEHVEDPVVRARLFAAIYERGVTPPTAEVRALVGRLVAEPPQVTLADGWWIASLAELAASVGIAKRQILRLIRALPLPQLSHASHRYDWLGDFRDPLRLAALRAQCRGRELSLEELMPTSVTDPPEDRRGRDADSERHDMHENVGRYLDVFLARASSLLRNPDAGELRAAWEERLGSSGRAAVYRSGERDFGFVTFASALTDAIVAARGEDHDLVAALADRVAEVAGAPQSSWLAIAERLIGDDRYRDAALRLVERAAEHAESAEWPASEKAEVLLDACAIADRTDPVHAAELHARAIRAAEGMDDDATGRLELHARLAATLAGTPDAAPLAWRTAEVVAGHKWRVSDSDHLPWRETVKACAALHAPTGLALVSRWEEGGHLSLYATAPAVARVVAANGYLAPAQAIALLPLAREHGAGIAAGTELLELIPAGPERAEALARLGLRIRRDILPGEREYAAQTLTAWAAEHGLADHESVARLAPYLASPAPAAGAAGPVRSRNWDDAGTREETDWERKERLADEVLERAAHADPSRVADDLAELAEFYGAARIPEYMHRVAERVVPSRRGALVDALGKLSPGHPVMTLHSDDVLAALLDAAEAWGGNSALARRIGAAIERVVEEGFVRLSRWGGMGDELAARLLAVRVVDDPPALVLRAIGASLEQLDARSLFAAAGQLAALLEPGDRARVLDWSLAAMEPEPVTVPALPADSAQVLAAMLWALIASPDKAVRWRAAHVARELGRASGAAFVKALFDRSANREGGAFAAAGLQFHWLSGRLWALMVIARVARDEPRVVAPLTDELACIALDRAWPHAGMREFARRAVLRVADTIPDALAAERLADVELANTPLVYKMERVDHFYRTGSGDRDYDTERFHFSIDTPSYVYGPFGERFDLSVDEVCARAESWIVDKLAIETDRDRDSRLDLLDYSQRDNHHGASPRGESWHQMLEEQALQFVAGEICDEGRVIEAEAGDEPRDPWGSFLENWTDSLEHAWLADEREPVPAVPALLLHDAGDADWWERLGEDEIRRTLAADDPDALVVDAYVQFSPAGGYGSTFITSALVNYETAPALVRALACSDDPGAFSLPQERGWTDQEDIDLGEFRLEGWIWEERREELGLERHDPLRRIGGDVTRPGPRFIAFCGGRLEGGGRRIRDRDGGLVAWQRAWSDLHSDHPRTEARGTSGTQTFVRRDVLSAFLRATGSLLIVKAWATRHKSTDNYLSDARERHDKRIDRVYLFDSERGLLE
jgi:hypothetical protein